MTDDDLALLRAVAERVMGWRWYCGRTGSRRFLDWPASAAGLLAAGDWIEASPEMPIDDRESIYPDWTGRDWTGRDWEQVVERMRGLGYTVCLTWQPDRQCFASITHPDDAEIHGTSAPTIGEAVCRAALAAVQKEVRE